MHYDPFREKRDARRHLNNEQNMISSFLDKVKYWYTNKIICGMGPSCHTNYVGSCIARNNIDDNIMSSCYTSSLGLK